MIVGQQPHRKIVSIILVTLLLALMLLPLQGVGACLMHALDHQPQPLPEMCDSVLLNCGCVSISFVIAFDMALIISLMTMRLVLLGWGTPALTYVVMRTFERSPDPPPPRLRIR